VSAPLAWDRLPQDIRNLQSLKSFCSATVTDTDKHDTDIDAVFADSLRPSNSSAPSYGALEIIGFIIIIFCPRE